MDLYEICTYQILAGQTRVDSIRLRPFKRVSVQALKASKAGSLYYSSHPTNGDFRKEPRILLYQQTRRCKQFYVRVALKKVRVVISAIKTADLYEICTYQILAGQTRVDFIRLCQALPYSERFSAGTQGFRSGFLPPILFVSPTTVPFGKEPRILL